MRDQALPTTGRRSSLASRRAVPTIYFDLASPYTYLAAERAERTFGRLNWAPASCEELRGGALGADADRVMVEHRARLLGLPLVWPSVPPSRVRCAMRVASLAAERGLGGRFVVAASRLLFCGDLDIENPRVLIDAAAAAGLDEHDMLCAARDVRRDAAIEFEGRRLVSAGAQRLPTLLVGGRLFCGEHRLSDAVAAANAGAAPEAGAPTFDSGAGAVPLRRFQTAIASRAARGPTNARPS